MSVRRLGATDVEAFRRVRLEALARDPDAFASTHAEWQALPEAAWAERLTMHPVFALFENGEPAGLAGLMRHVPSRMAHRASLIMMYVRASLRGHGGAAGLLDAVAAQVVADGILQLELSVSTENPRAVSFYRKSGFEIVGRVPRGFAFDGRFVDEFLMVRALDGAG